MAALAGPAGPQQARQQLVGAVQAMQPMQEVWQHTGTRLWGIARKQPSKAPGPDGWDAATWKTWPLRFWERLAELFNLVEEKGRWPQAFGSAHVAMLDKDGPAHGLEARPITLLSGIYRLWAKARLW